MKIKVNIKRNIFLLCVMVLTFLTFSSLALAKDINSSKKSSVNNIWQEIDVGPAEAWRYEFNTDTIKYDRNSDGTINKNIILYEEKKTNNVSMSSEFNYYSITKCKINVKEHSICFGDESFYTKKDKFRWSDTPAYLTWLTVKAETIGGMRFLEIVNYAIEHDEQLINRS